ncbi:MAG: response regulator transcription factor, partial [Candidatus Binatia bacterium]
MQRSACKVKPPTVFVVENDASVRDGLAFLLEGAGFAVQTFEKAESFLAACGADQPGCLILDVRLPGMSGLMLHEQLESVGVVLPVIVITGYASVDTAVRVLKRGAIDFIEKPFSDEVILERVREAMLLDAERRRRAALRQQLSARLDRLTARERQVFEEVVHGKANKVVAYEFGISEKTVEAHRARVMQKLGAASLAELVRMDLVFHQADRHHWSVRPMLFDTWS